MAGRKGLLLAVSFNGRVKASGPFGDISDHIVEPITIDIIRSKRRLIPVVVTDWSFAEVERIAAILSSL